MFELFKSKNIVRKRPFQLNELIEILQDGVCITRDAGELIYMNKAAYFFLQIPQNSDISQLNFFDNFIRDNSQIDFLKKQFESEGIVRNFEIQVKTFDSEILDVILTANILGDYKQDTFGFLFLFKDISEIKKMQQQLLQTQKLESIGLMASGIAHDFNNILAAIIPNAELIKISCPQKAANYKRAEIIEKSAHRASEIAQRLLTFTRQSDQRNFEPVNLSKIVSDSIDLLESSIPGNIEIKKNFHENTKNILGDAAQIQQIIMNLVINAVDAMSEGGSIGIQIQNFYVENFFQIGALDPGEYVKLTIEDTGTGIPLEIMPKIFDPFFTTKDIGKGTGLGLSVVYGIVKGMNGHIDVSNRNESGTRFDIYLPVEPTNNNEQDDNTIEIHENKNIRLLLIDDEDYVLNILSDTLEYLGYDIVKFNNGRSAIQYLHSNKTNIDYAIVDIKMPDLDGRLTSQELRKINPNLKIIFTSGFDDQPINDENIAGVVGFLRKPYSIRQVSRSLKEIME